MNHDYTYTDYTEFFIDLKKTVMLLDFSNPF